MLFGPHTGHVPSMAAEVLSTGAGERVEDAGALAAAWVRLVTDDAARARRIDAGRRLLERHRGALTRTVDLVRGVLAP